MVNRTFGAKILTKLSQILNLKKEQKMVKSKLSSNMQSYASTTVIKANLLNFFELLAVFMLRKNNIKKEKTKKKTILIFD